MRDDKSVVMWRSSVITKPIKKLPLYRTCGQQRQCIKQTVTVRESEVYCSPRTTQLKKCWLEGEDERTDGEHRQ